MKRSNFRASGLTAGLLIASALLSAGVARAQNGFQDENALTVDQLQAMLDQDVHERPKIDQDPHCIVGNYAYDKDECELAKKQADAAIKDLTDRISAKKAAAAAEPPKPTLNCGAKSVPKSQEAEFCAQGSLCRDNCKYDFLGRLRPQVNVDKEIADRKKKGEEERRKGQQNGGNPTKAPVETYAHCFDRSMKQCGQEQCADKTAETTPTKALCLKSNCLAAVKAICQGLRTMNANSNRATPP
jgi:hypothetical protein